jgi:hypothetical protein
MVNIHSSFMFQNEYEQMITIEFLWPQLTHGWILLDSHESFCDHVNYKYHCIDLYGIYIVVTEKDITVIDKDLTFMFCMSIAFLRLWRLLQSIYNIHI